MPMLVAMPLRFSLIFHYAAAAAISSPPLSLFIRLIIAAVFIKLIDY